MALRAWYKRWGKTADWFFYIAFLRHALALRPLGHPERYIFLRKLAHGLSTRYKQFGKVEDLEEAILFQREVVALCPPGHKDRFISLNHLAFSLSSRCELLNNFKMEDLEEALLLYHEAHTLCLPGNPNRLLFLNHLAQGMFLRHALLGKIVDLEEAIVFEREILTFRAQGDPNRFESFVHLGLYLTSRYQILDNNVDLEDSILFLCNAVTLCPPGDPYQYLSLCSLAVGFFIRYVKKSGNLKDLEEAILLNRKALTIAPSADTHRLFALGGLAKCLTYRYDQLGTMEDLEEAILLQCEALTICSPSQPLRSFFLTNIASYLIDRYEQFGKMTDVEEALLFGHEALTLCPPGHPGRSDCLFQLANGVRTRYEHLGKTEDLQAMFIYYKQSATDSTSYLFSRLGAAMRWAQAARNHQHYTTLTAYTTSLNLCNHFSISRPNFQAHLSTAHISTSLALDAASAAIQAGILELAVEFLEQGRAMLWSKIDAYKYPLEQLREVQGGGELADRLETLSNELEHLVLLSDQNTALRAESSTHGQSLDVRMKRHRVLSEEWEALVGKIRKTPGFDHFLQTPPFNTLRLAAAEGPVILVNISEYRSDAIILTIDNPPILVRLSEINPSELAAQAGKLTTNWGIITVLRYLWENIASHVVTRLAELGVEPKSRIWWCPTAELCALPLHVAGPYRARKQNLQDIYTSSYTSTLSSLIKASSGIQVSESPKLLVIGQPHESLEKVGAEVGLIKQADNVNVDVLLGDEATHEAVLSSLRQHSWAHFACHGHLADDNQPFPSFELFEGRRLTLLELIQARLPNAESAFLAACHSAGGDSSARDEHIHLSAALQFCGFRSVVGTLWEMFDEDGPKIAKEFYKYLFRDPAKINFRDSAYALNSAVRAMRRANLPPERWAMFVHIGA